MEYSFLSKKSPKLCATAPESPWKKFPCMGTCTIYRQVGTADGREEQGTGPAPSRWDGDVEMPGASRS